MSGGVLVGIAIGIALGALFAGAKVREEWARKNYQGAKAAVRITRPIWWRALLRYVGVGIFVLAALAACLHLYSTRSPR